MVALSTLWLPILLSAVIVFVASSIIHMALPWHKNDYPAVPDQDKVMDALRPFGIAPGDYVVPRAADHKAMRTPEFAEKLNKGPVMILTVMPNGQWTMGRSLVLWFLYSAAVGLFGRVRREPRAAGRHAVPACFPNRGGDAFIGYAVALWQMSIWYRRAWSTTIKATVDGLIYALLTAGVFGWLWPH